MAVFPVAVGVKVLGAEKKGIAIEAGVVRETEAEVDGETEGVGAACGAADCGANPASAGVLVSWEFDQEVKW